jgi:hypothetical protein
VSLTTIQYSGFYYCDATVTNAPTGMSAGYLLVVGNKETGTATAFQLFCPGVGEVWYRLGSEMVYSAWTKLNIKISSAAFVGNDIVFTMNDSSTITITDGKTAITGQQGEQGIQGIQGLKGDTGEQGIQGLQGEPGANGTDGQSAYAAAQVGGYAGTQTDFYTDLAAISGLAGELAAI